MNQEDDLDRELEEEYKEMELDRELTEEYKELNRSFDDSDLLTEEQKELQRVLHPSFWLNDEGLQRLRAHCPCETTYEWADALKDFSDVFMGKKSTEDCPNVLIINLNNYTKGELFDTLEKFREKNES